MHSSCKMLGANSYPRRGRYGVSTAATTPLQTHNSSNNFLVRPRIPLRSYSRPKTAANLLGVDAIGFGRSKRLKSRKLNGFQKPETTKKKGPDYTDFAYREAVSKLKYLLAESYNPRTTPRGGRYNTGSNPKINIESGEDTDDRSLASEVSQGKGLLGNLPPSSSPYLPRTKNSQLSRGCSNLAVLSRDPQSAPPELMSFIEKQEEYIEQLEKESQYCRDELGNLLGKVREVVAENDTLHDKNKNGFLKSVLDVYNDNSEEENQEPNDHSLQRDTGGKGKRVRLQKILEGPSIVFESRISELEAQLTQAKVELRKVEEENQANLRRLLEMGGGENNAEAKVQLERALRDKREAEAKLEELQRSLASVRDREADTAHKAKRTLDVLEHAQFEKSQAEAETRRLRDELERQHERLREAAQETSRRVAEERHQIERRYSQQIEQLTADAASHWDTASKSQLESEKQRREMGDLRRDLAQKQALIEELKKELQSKISAMQSDLSQAVAEKDAAEQEISASKLSAERAERQARQEQNRLQSEINSYKQRLERADADLVHCRRENLRLSEQIASLEKEVSLNKMVTSEEHRTPGTATRGESDKELTSMIMDIETKHATTVAGLEDALANQATVVSQLSVECQSLTQRLEANSLKHKEEMASLQSNLNYLTSKIQDSLVQQNDNPDTSVHPKYNTSSANSGTGLEDQQQKFASDQAKGRRPSEKNLQPPIANTDSTATVENDVNNDKRNREVEISNAEQDDDHQAVDYPVPNANEDQDTANHRQMENDPNQVQSDPQLLGNYESQEINPGNTNNQDYDLENYQMDNQNYDSQYADQSYEQYDRYNQGQYEEGGEQVRYDENPEMYQNMPYTEQDYQGYGTEYEGATEEQQAHSVAEQPLEIGGALETDERDFGKHQTIADNAAASMAGEE
ncbi:serologically defined colon cancer antigen 8 homolog [Athalia rosae]|uniref:serologically defined colon cancer antigen 8 homolog n=1 Tax=Athalia rosae TaxID=37344 RepID=UPI0020339F2C|nr:serologically defined colon cancer antigen 8 homolog [Athalia rosae]